MDLFIGCSGFHYKEWKGIFYPEGLPQKEQFAHYCKYFSTLELNVTFYRFPQLSALQSWYNRSPDNFRFSVKAPKTITHQHRMLDVAPIVQDFYGVIAEGLKEKSGYILFQFPPSFAYVPEHLDRILDHLDSQYQNAVEFRHLSWWNETVYEQLTARQITFCGISYPGFPENVIANTPGLYYRLHGRPELYISAYTAAELDQLALQLKTSGSTAAYVYFNNTMDAHAIANALYLKKQLNEG